MSETISRCKLNRMIWEWKKKRNVVLSRYTFLLFFPLEIAGFCCGNSSFGPEHEIVEIEFGSCSIQPLFSTFSSTSWYVFSTTWREDPEEICAHQALGHHARFLSVVLHWDVSSAFPGCRYPESVFEHPLGGWVWQSSLFRELCNMGKDRVLQSGFTDDFTGHHSSPLNWVYSVFPVLHLGNGRKQHHKHLAQAHLGLCWEYENVILSCFLPWHMLRRAQVCCQRCSAQVWAPKRCSTQVCSHGRVILPIGHTLYLWVPSKAHFNRLQKWLHFAFYFFFSFEGEATQVWRYRALPRDINLY